MDFHSLTRKELQALCKLNKIPANLTNVAMADSLSALEHVEGLEGILNPSQSGPDESSIIGTPAGPRTSCRTSTRPRKPVIMECSQSMTRTRRATREVAEEVKEESCDVASKTPAARSTLRRAPVPSAARKTEIASIQRAYSTRRSVKLLEETMEKMCLGNDVPVTTDELSKEVSSVKIEEGLPEMQMELKYDVYDDAVKEEKVDVKNETSIEEVIDCEPVAELSNEFIKDVEVSDETIEEEEEVSLKLESPVEKSTHGDWVVVANHGGDIDDVKAEVVQSESAMEEDKDEAKKESSEEDEIKSVEAIELSSESVTEKETSEPIPEDEETEDEESSEEDEIESVEVSKLPSESVADKETSEPISEDEETEDEESSEEDEIESVEAIKLTSESVADKETTEPISEDEETEDEESSEEEEEESDEEEVESKKASLAIFDATQFPRPSLPKPGKSSAEAHPVIQKIENILDEDKEMETEVKKTDLKKLEDKSLRELHKMLRTKLRITNEKKEPNTTRIALQSLPENRLAVNEQKD